MLNWFLWRIIVIVSQSYFFQKFQVEITPACDFMAKLTNFVIILLVIFSNRLFRQGRNPYWSFYKNVRDYFITSILFNAALFNYRECFVNGDSFSMVTTLNDCKANIPYIVYAFVGLLPFAGFIDSHFWHLINYIAVTNRAYLTMEYLLIIYKQIKQEIVHPLPMQDPAKVTTKFVMIVTFEG